MTPFAIFLASEHHIKLTVRKHGIGTADISFVAGASPRSFDWGGGDSGALNPPSTKFWFLFLEFRSLRFENIEDPKKIVSTRIFPVKMAISGRRPLQNFKLGDASTRSSLGRDTHDF